MHSMKPDAYYTDIIARPIVRKVNQLHTRLTLIEFSIQFTFQSGLNREVETTAEDEQQFLLRQQQYLQQGTTPPSSGSFPTAIQKTPDRKPSATIGGVQGSPKKVGGKQLLAGKLFKGWFLFWVYSLFSVRKFCLLFKRICTLKSVLCSQEFCRGIRNDLNVIFLAQVILHY